MKVIAPFTTLCGDRDQGATSGLNAWPWTLRTGGQWISSSVCQLQASQHVRTHFYFLFLINLRVPEAHVKGSAASADVAGVHLASTLLPRV